MSLLISFILGVWLGGAVVMWWLADNLEFYGIAMKLPNYRGMTLFLVSLGWPQIIFSRDDRE